MRKRRSVPNASCLGSPWILALLLALVPSWLGAQASNTPRPEMWFTNGPVSAIAATDDTVYLGGDFTFVHPFTGSGVPLDENTGNPIDPFPRVNGTIHASASDGSGGWYIGGDFTEAGGVARNRVARVLANGSVDPVWNPGANGTVNALAVSGSTVYAGGSFTVIGGQTRNHLAALDNATGAALPWETDYLNSPVNALAASDSALYVGGDFTVVGMDTGSGAPFDETTGNPAHPFSRVNGTIYATVSDGSGGWYIGGDFTEAGGLTRNRAAHLLVDGSVNPGWDPGADGTVRALAVSGSTVYAGGDFTAIGGQPRNHLAALDAGTGAALPWETNYLDSSVTALAVSDSTLYVGGDFSVAGTNTGPGVPLDKDTGNPVRPFPHVNGTIFTSAPDGSGGWYIGGSFTNVGGIPRNRIARILADGSVDPGWDPDARNINISGLSQGQADVSSLVVSGSTVYVVGRFNTIGGQTFSHLNPFTGSSQQYRTFAALDGITGTVLPWETACLSRNFPILPSIRAFC